VTNRGPDPYWTSYTYSTVGNRLTETVHATGGGADTLRTYSYPTPGGVRPHALSQVVSTGGVTGTDTYNYDNTGNTTSRTVAGTSQTLTWDDEGHLATHAINGQTTSYIYDTSGSRLIRRNPDGSAVAYLPGGWELARSSGGTLTCTRYYSHNGRTIAVRGATGLTYLAADLNGTATTTINPTTLAVTTRRTMPFGAPRGTQPTWPTDKGHVGGTTDPTGLTHLGAREYDPAIGRFISVDPLLVTNDPQQLNAYTYAGNSPVTFTDPEGTRRCPPSQEDTCTEDPQSYAEATLGQDKQPMEPRCTRKVCDAQTLMEISMYRESQCLIGHHPSECVIGAGITEGGWALLAIKYGKIYNLDPRILLAIILMEARDLGANELVQDGQVTLDHNPWLFSVAFGIPGAFLADDDGASIGITNVKENVFGAAQDRRPDLFGGREWSDLVRDDDLAVAILANRLAFDVTQSIHGRNASGLSDELAAAVMHQTGVEVHRGLRTRSPEQAARAAGHIPRLLKSYDRANEIICMTGIWQC
jgi:RHS repeat-associated protein